MLVPPFQTAKLLPAICRHELIRCISASKNLDVHNKSKFEATRAAKMMAKIMTGSIRAARKADLSHPTKILADFGFIQKRTTGISGHKLGSAGRHMRRTDMLNNLFVEQITSLLATGEVAPDFIGLGVQISKVKVTADFSAVNVYWSATGTESDEKIEKLLANSAGHLRHELSTLRVVGVVPPINFFKDTTFSKLQEVQTILAKCNLKETNSSKIPCSVKENFESDESIEEELSLEKIDMDNPMSHDILGVNHARIMNGIKKSLEKRSEKKRAQERNLAQASAVCSAEIEDLENDQEIGTVEQEVQNHRKRQHEFLKYLKKQQAEKNKKLKLMSVEEYDKEFYRSIREERMANQLRNRIEEMDSPDDDVNSSDVEDDKFDEEREAYYENLRERFK